MNILYFGTVCDLKNYNNLLRDSKVKPSVAPIVFETALLDGFKKNGADMEIHSFPMIPTFPKIRLLRFGNNVEKLTCGYECHWLNTVNLPVIKQISRRLSGRKVLKRWCKENRGKGMILTYSVPPFLVKDVIKYGKKYSVKTAALIPDLLRDMYINERTASLLTKLKKLYIRPALKLQDQYDGYVYLTDAMHSVVAPDKPYTVMEGIAATDAQSAYTAESKAFPRGVMYAGMLHEKYGIINLIDAFERLDMPHTELWLFGDGTARSEIEKRVAKNASIKYFGTVERNTILRYEREATLLVNPRDPDEEFTKYSFPSKTIEYMLSGTPLLTTRLKGIPTEYFNHVFCADCNSTAVLAASLKLALTHTDEELAHMGARARDFIMTEKNSENQVLKVINFLNEV